MEVAMNRIGGNVRQLGRNHVVAALGHVSAGVVLVIGLASSGCALDGTDEQVGGEQQELVGNNGMSLNGMSLNGMSINGMSLNGMSLNGMSLNGMSLNGMSLNGMSLNGSQLGGVTGEGQPVSGTALVGATLDGVLSSGDTLPLRVDSASHLAGSNSDVWAYAVSFQAESWTANGTPINLYDGIGIQADDATWAVDAEWTAEGAICTNHIRDFQPGAPSCVPDLTDPACGTFAGGALIINEYGG
jgi:hypothetical protein